MPRYRRSRLFKSFRGLAFVVIFLLLSGLLFRIVRGMSHEIQPAVLPIEWRRFAKETDFSRTLRSHLLAQYGVYMRSCRGSDICHPVSNTYQNVTGASEMPLAALTAFHLLANDSLPVINGDSVDFTRMVGLETAHVADSIIAPLVSAYWITGDAAYANRAISVGRKLIETWQGPLPFPFIGLREGEVGTRDVFIDSISSIFPVLAALRRISGDDAFVWPIMRFLGLLGKDSRKSPFPIRYSLEDNAVKGEKGDLLPYSVYADIARVHEIIPDIDVSALLNYAFEAVRKKEPLLMLQGRSLEIYSIHSCSVAAYIRQNDPAYRKLVEKCEKLIKNRVIPKRMYGKVWSGDYELMSGFEFEGELLELLWREGKVQEARKMILDSLSATTFNGVVTGMVNLTGPVCDDMLHPELFSRWIANGVLIDGGLAFDQVTTAHNGHVLNIRD